PPRPSLREGGGSGLPGVSAQGRLLHPDRRGALAPRVRMRQRLRLRDVPGQGDRCGDGAGIFLLLDERPRAHQDPFLLPEDRRHAHRGRKATPEASPLSLRESARSIFDAALAASAVRPLVIRALAGIAPPEKGRVLVVGAGKASGAMAATVEEIWGDRIVDGLVAVKDGHVAPTRRVRLVEAGHPVPDERGAEAAREIRVLAEAAGADDLVLVLVSGGCSALTPAPTPPITLADKQGVTRLLLAAGANIGQLNTVRKHCSMLKGGRLARAASPARVEALLLSDVIGDPLDVIGSGPTAPDDSTFAEALAVLDGFGLLGPAPSSGAGRRGGGARGGGPQTPPR